LALLDDSLAVAVSWWADRDLYPVVLRNRGEADGDPVLSAGEQTVANRSNRYTLVSVKRYLQNAHPDRLLEPLERDSSASGGLRTVTWDHALDRTVSEIRRIQSTYGNDSFAMPQAIVALDQVRERTAHLFHCPSKDAPAILVHLPGGELRAFSQKCTHLGCVIYYAPERGEMECPCHEGHFDAITGNVLAGPPQRPLGRINVEVRDGIVWALAALGAEGSA
jgi:Rieske Fe-S protein